jgi:MinD superfamily P-loop ATPase
VNLAVFLAQERRLRVLIVDCDVDNPNTNILLGVPLPEERTAIHTFLPSIDEQTCEGSACAKCVSACYMHALIIFPGQPPMLFPNMCSGCEVCARICPRDAITASEKTVGHYYEILGRGQEPDLIVGELLEGETAAVEIIEVITRRAMALADQYDVIILDSGPGIHCDVQRVLQTAGQVLCVTEPTPFGEFDLERILSLAKLVGQQPHVVLNRAGLTDYEAPIIAVIERFGASSAGQIPLDDQIRRCYNRGQAVVAWEGDSPGKAAMMSVFDRLASEWGLGT